MNGEISCRDKRNSSIEVLKLIAMLLIIFSSALPFGATYRGGYPNVYQNLKTTEFSLQHIIFTFFRWLGQIGDTLFLCCSAFFFCDNNKVKGYKVIKLIADSWIISIMGLFLAFFFMTPNFEYIFRSFFPVTTQMNWFVGCYILYYLIHPLCNQAVSNLKKNELLLLAGVLFLLYSIPQFIYSGLFYYNHLVGFIAIHYFVMYYKRYMSISIKKSWLGIIISFSMILFWIILINYIGEGNAFVNKNGLCGCIFINPLIVVIGISALNLANVHKSLEIKWLNSITQLSILVYLIHCNYFWLTYGKYKLLTFMTDRGMTLIGSVLILIILYIILSLFFAIIYKKTLGKFINKLSNWLSSKIEKLCKIKE